jgi:adenine-specific DNA-methyltransferase
MYPRLKLARELLARQGVIFVSIDDNEVDRLRLIMAEIFGLENFVAQITVISNPRGRQAEKHFAGVHEYLLVYARDATSLKLNGAALTAEQLKEFDETDELGRPYRLLGLRQRGSHSLREDRPQMYYPLYVDPATASISLKKTSRHHVEVLPRKSTGEAGRWMWGHQKAQQELARLQARLIRGNRWDIYVRDYLQAKDGEDRRRKLKTVWDDKLLNYQNGKRDLKSLLGACLVDYPKPVALLSKIVDMVDGDDAVFLDFFAGSGTLGAAVMRANARDGQHRRFLLVQRAEPTRDPRYPTIADFCRQRLAAESKRLRDTASGDFGFRYLKIAARG